jgi:hypothetical protein
VPTRNILIAMLLECFPVQIFRHQVMQTERLADLKRAHGVGTAQTDGNARLALNTADELLDLASKIWSVTSNTRLLRALRDSRALCSLL